MKKERCFVLSFCLLSAFLLLTFAVTRVDLQNTGIGDFVVGFGKINIRFHRFTGVHLWIYNLTDRLSAVPLLICFGFGILGLYQLVKRKSIFKVDRDILILGLLYIATIGFYLFFEVNIINYRPILIDGKREASYPSSTTVLCLTVMLTAARQFQIRIKNKKIAGAVSKLSAGYGILMMIARLVSGVHWLTDILGGVLLSLRLVSAYNWRCETENRI